MKVAVVGCVHGELDAIYSALRETERARNIAIDLVICPGDMQAIRNTADLQCMACPQRFRHMRSFWKYYAGKESAPWPTIFVGGNHEAVNHLQEIPLGGLAAKNMYFMGKAGVIRYRGLRIAGIGGVYVEHNYEKESTESPPYPGSSMRSVYHIRKKDVERVGRLSGNIDIMISHDWPRGIWEYGDKETLLKKKSFLRKEMEEGSLGNPGTAQLLHALQPRYWFAAHMHVKFPALVDHEGGKRTRFLALDKAMPRREFVQILDIHPETLPEEVTFKDREARVDEAPDYPIDLDSEWLAILKAESEGLYVETPITMESRQEVAKLFEEQDIKSYVRPIQDFEMTGVPHDPQATKMAMPQVVELQERSKRLLDGLGLKGTEWRPSETTTKTDNVECLEKGSIMLESTV